MSNNLLLDTCALIWLTSDQDKLNPDTLSLIDEADLVYISSITAWEISLLVQKEKLELPLPIEEWFSEVSEKHDILIIPIELEIALKSNELPPHHKDPADRFIIASAMINSLTIVTADKKISLYDVDVIL